MQRMKKQNKTNKTKPKQKQKEKIQATFNQICIYLKFCCRFIHFTESCSSVIQGE